jgi:hypothetical protein
VRWTSATLRDIKGVSPWLVSTIQIRIVEVAAAAKSFWYDAAVAGEEADCPWKAHLQNRFVAETFPPRLAYKEKHSGSCFHSEELTFPPLHSDLEHS